MIEIVAPPMNLIEIDAGRLPKPDDYKRVSWGEITKAYGAAWYMDLSVGRVFFKRLGQIRRDDVNARWAREHPEFVEIVRELDILREFADNGVPLDHAHTKKLEELNFALMPIEKLQYLECVFDQGDDGKLHKCLNSVDELDAFLSALLPAEVDAVYAALREMITSRPITEDSKVLLMIAQEYHIPIAKDVSLDTMTAEMADALVNTVVEKGEAMRAEMGRLSNAK